MSEGRDTTTGRFASGNRYGRGSTIMRQRRALSDQLRAATTRDEIADVLAKLRDLALRGDVAAANSWLSYVVGRPREADATPAAIALPPDTTSPAGVVATLDTLVRAAAAGQLAVADATALAGVVSRIGDATALADFDARLRQIEGAHRAAP